MQSPPYKALHRCIWWLRGSALVGLLACQPAALPPLAGAPGGATSAAMPTLSPPSTADDTAAANLNDEAQRLSQSNRVEAAQRKRDQLLLRYPRSLAAADLFANNAQAALSRGHLAQALAWYQKLLLALQGREAQSNRYSRAQQATASLLQQVGRAGESALLWEALWQQARQQPAAPTALGGLTPEAWQYAKALASAWDEADRSYDALTLLVDLHTRARGNASEQHALASHANNVVVHLNQTALLQLWESVKDQAAWQFLRTTVAFKLAKLYYHVGEFTRSTTFLQEAVASPKNDFSGAAQQFLQFSRDRFRVEPHTVGIILPLSGKYKLFGERSLQAIKLAVHHHSISHANTPELKLVIKDSQGDSATAAQAVEALVLQHHVVAILGPLFSGEALAAALKAEELSVPMLSLSHREGLAKLGPYIFRTALTASAQARALAQVAFETLHFSRFAVLYPKSGYGNDFMQTFWDEVDARHGEIRGIEAYEPDQTTFREPVRRLVGRWYMGARADYRAALMALRAQKMSPLRYRSEVKRLDKSLGPLIDFQAVVIPDSGRQIGLIAPALAFEDIVLTHDPKILERIKKTSKSDVKPMTLLGGSTWNSSQTLDSCEAYCEDSVFVDGFFAQSSEPAVHDFVEAFRNATAGSPPQLNEALAYDTTALLQNVLLRSAPTSRLALREALASSPPFPGISGTWSFDADGEAQKNLYVLTIKEHNIQPFTAPPELSTL